MNYWIDHFYHASLFSKGIYAMLFGLSIYAWTIIFRKMVLFKRIRRENAYYLNLYRKSRRDPMPLYHHLQQSRRTFRSPVVALLAKTCEEIESLQKENAEAGERSLSILQIESLQEILLAEMEKISGWLDSGQNFLATTSSVAPLLGLLGTVWGILEAFRSIGLQGSATAASMAPGMSEALITTVVGLMVAIPANLAYNFLGQKAKNLSLEGDNFVTEIITNLERFGGLK